MSCMRIVVLRFFFVDRPRPIALMLMHAVQRRVQLKSDLWELEVIILDASVKWELTAWPLMDMANVAVSTLLAGAR